MHSVRVLSRVPKCKKVTVCLIENIHVLAMFCLGVSYSVVGYDFNISDQQNGIHRKRKRICQFTRGTPDSAIVEDNAMKKTKRF